MLEIRVNQKNWGSAKSYSKTIPLKRMARYRVGVEQRWSLFLKKKSPHEIMWTFLKKIVVLIQQQPQVQLQQSGHCQNLLWPYTYLIL